MLFTRRTHHNIPLLIAAVVLLILTACASPGPAVVSSPATSTDVAAPSSVAPATSTDIAASSSVPSAVSAPAMPSTAISTTPEASFSPSPEASVSPSIEPSAVTSELQPQIAVVRPDNTVVLMQGDDAQTITTLSRTPVCGDFEWSPDGYRLALQHGVYTFGADANVVPVLSPIAGMDFRWSPDGQRLAWLAGVEEHLDVIRVGGADGDEAKAIAGTHWGYMGLTAWSEDGQTVASGAVEAAADGSTFEIIEGRGRNPSWAPDGQRIAWTTNADTDAEFVVAVIVDRGSEQETAGNIRFPRPPGSAAAPAELERVRLRWPSDGGLLVPVPHGILASGAGTYLVKDGNVELLSPHVLCDLSPDGQQMVARTADDQIVIARLADGDVERELGAGIAAMWRPERKGQPPSTPLADKSPTLALTTPPTQGQAVMELQRRLSEQGFDVGKIDGIFGPRTEQAVRAFQENHGLSVDGVVGPLTWAALRLDAEQAIKQFLSNP